MYQLLLFFSALLIYPVSSAVIIYGINIFFSLIILFAYFYPKSETPHFKFSIFELAYIFIFVLMPVISNFYSISRYDTLLGIYQNLIYLQLLIVLKIYITKKNAETFIKKIGILIIVTAITALFYDNFKTARLTFTYRNPNILADIFALGILVFIFYYKSGIRISGVLFLVTVFSLTKSFGAISALSATAAIFIFYFLIKNYKGGRLIIPLITILIIAIPVFLAYKSRIARNIGDPFAHKRLEIFNASIKAMRDNYLFGSGHNTYEYKIKKYVFPIDNTDLKFFKTQKNPHNFFLHISNELGIVGLIFLLLFLLRLILFSFKRLNIRNILFGCAGMMFLIIHHQAETGYPIIIINIFLLLLIYFQTLHNANLIEINLKRFNKIIIGVFIIILFIIPTLNITAEILFNQAVNLSKKNLADKAINKFKKTGYLIPEYGEARQRLGGEYRKKFNETNDVTYLFNSLDSLYSGLLYNQYNSNFQLNIAKVLYSIDSLKYYLNNSDIDYKKINFIKYYCKKSIETEPYNIVLYFETAEMLYNIGFKNDAINIAKLGLICEPYFLRLHKLLELIDSENSASHKTMFEKYLNYSRARINAFDIKEISADDRAERYYYQILYNSYVKILIK